VPGVETVCLDFAVSAPDGHYNPNDKSLHLHSHYFLVPQERGEYGVIDKVSGEALMTLFEERAHAGQAVKGTMDLDKAEYIKYYLELEAIAKAQAAAAMSEAGKINTDRDGDILAVYRMTLEKTGKGEQALEQARQAFYADHARLSYYEKHYAAEWEKNNGQFPILPGKDGIDKDKAFNADKVIELGLFLKAYVGKLKGKTLNTYNTHKSEALIVVQNDIINKKITLVEGSNLDSVTNGTFEGVYITCGELKKYARQKKLHWRMVKTFGGDLYTPMIKMMIDAPAAKVKPKKSMARPRKKQKYSLS